MKFEQSSESYKNIRVLEHVAPGSQVCFTRQY